MSVVKAEAECSCPLLRDGALEVDVDVTTFEKDFLPLAFDLKAQTSERASDSSFPTSVDSF